MARAPFVILGAIGLFSIVGTFVTLEDNIAMSLEAWRTVTRPIWDFILGWIFDYFKVELPFYLYDYLTMGLISTAMYFRYSIANIRAHYAENPTERSMNTREILAGTSPAFFLALLSIILIWPFIWYLGLRGFSVVANDEKQARSLSKSIGVFWETAVFSLILIAINYTLVSYFALPSEPPEIEIWVVLTGRQIVV